MEENHLIGRGPLEEPWPDQIAPGLGPGLHQALPFELAADGLRAGFQEEPTPQQLRDPLNAEAGVLLLQLDDLLGDRRRQPLTGGAGPHRAHALLAPGFVDTQPIMHRGRAHSHLLANQRHAESFFQVQLHRPKLQFGRTPASRSFPAARTPPRGGVSSSLSVDSLPC